MTEREHFYQTLVEHKNTGIVPNYGANVIVGCGGAREEYENGPAGGGFDAFGVRWEATEFRGRSSCTHVGACGAYRYHGLGRPG